jgi:predicted Rossmann fold nucleotide-binding protein DprA/Smf involved in DNA uptake
LIRDGATLVSEYAHVREACATLTAAALLAQESAAAAESSAAEPAATERRRDGEPAGPVDPVEELVAEALPTSRAPAGFDVLTLARATGVRPDAVFAALGRLAACGRAVKLGGGWMLATPT